MSPVNGFKIGVVFGRVFVAWQNPENPTPLVINQNDAQVFRNIIVPQAVDVVKET